MTWLRRNLWWAWIPFGLLVFVVAVTAVRCQNAERWNNSGPTQE